MGDPQLFLRNLYLYWDTVRRERISIIKSGYVGKTGLKSLNASLLTPDSTLEDARNEGETTLLHLLRQVLSALKLVEVRDGELQPRTKAASTIPELWQQPTVEQVRAIVAIWRTLDQPHLLRRHDLQYTFGADVRQGCHTLLVELAEIPAGAWLGLRDFPGRRWLTAAIYTGMGFPPVVIGLLVYLLLSRQGVLGDWGWLFTPKAMILAQIVLALPLVTGVTMGAVRGVSRELQPQLRALGATSRQITWTILREARFGVILGLVAGFGGAISEVGAVMLVGGNIDGQTRVLTTAIVLETRRGNFGLALALGIILMLIAFLANLVAVRLQIGSE
ncbi:MAG: ABC transporter permease [Anaerolineales bacterium]|nr:ABC transporter permease [Anaerolineales bacterium]